jgi:hypothetical protein
MVFSFQVAGKFSVTVLLLVSRLIPSWSENTLHMISVILNLLSFVLFLRMWSVLVSSMSYEKQCIFYCGVNCSINVNFSLWVDAVFKFYILADFCRVLVSVSGRLILNCPTAIIDFPISNFRSINFGYLSTPSSQK